MTRWPCAMMPPPAGGRIIGYARVSMSDQKLDHQLDLLEKVGCHKVFCDHGVSGGKARRDGLDKALEYLGTDDVLVVYKLDRLGRSVLHLSDLITRFDNQGIHFCSLSEGIDTTTSGGKLVFHIFAAMAEFHRDLIRENTLSGLEAARTCASPPLAVPTRTVTATVVPTADCSTVGGSATSSADSASESRLGSLPK